MKEAQSATEKLKQEYETKLWKQYDDHEQEIVRTKEEHKAHK